MEISFPPALKDSFPEQAKYLGTIREDTSRLIYLLSLCDKISEKKRTYAFHTITDYLRHLQFDTLTLPYKFSLLKKIANYYGSLQPDSSLYYLKLGIEEASKGNKYLPEVAHLNRDIGLLYFKHSNIIDAIAYYDRAIDAAEMSGNKQICVRYLTELGSVYQNIGEFNKARQYYLKGKEHGEKIKDYNLLLYSFNSLGDLSRLQGDLDTALYFHFKALEAQKKLSDNPDLWAYASLGKIYASKNDFTTAINYFNTILNEAKRNNQPNLVTQAYINLSTCHLKLGNASEALKYAYEAFHLSDMFYDINLKSVTAKKLSQIYESQNEFGKSLKYYKIYKLLEDSIATNTQMKKVAAAEFKQKENALLATIEKNGEKLKAEQEKRQMESKRSKIIILFVSIVLFTTGTFALLIYRSLQNNKKQNRIISRQKFQVEKQKQLIEEQKRIVEDKNKEVLDSIHYAKRIQQALLPSEKFIERKLENLKS